MKVLLAGRVSEQITFGRVTTGAADDLSARHRRSRGRWSTSTRWAPRSAPTRFPADDFGASEALRRTRDEEVQAIAEEAYRGAHRLLVDHRDLLDEIAERLLANEVIEREEIVEILLRTAAVERASTPTPSPSASPRSRPTSRPSATEALASKPPPPPRIDSARMFGLIDHVGVAVDDLDARDRPLRGNASGCRSSTARRSRTGRRGGAARRRRRPRRAAAPARARDAGRQVHGAQAARACTTSPTASTTSTRRSSSLAGDGIELIDSEARVGHPRQPGRLPAPAIDRARPDRDRRAGGGSLMAEAQRKVEIGLGIGQVVTARLDEGEPEASCARRVETGDGWHEVTTDDGDPRHQPQDGRLPPRRGPRTHSIGFAGS